VHGAGFVNGDVVKWNGSALQTTFVSNTKLTAAVPAANIAAAGTIFVMVSNATGGTSNSVYFQVTTPTTSLAYTRTDTDFSSGAGGQPTITQPTAVAVGMFTNDGTPYLAVTDFSCGLVLNCIQEHAFITFVHEGVFSSGFDYTGQAPSMIGIGDFTGNGAEDLITLNGGSYSILLGNLDGPPHHDYLLPGPTAFGFTLGDFNADGHLDFAVCTDTGVYVFLGNGDGTFGPGVNYDTGAMLAGIVAGDFNGDGKLDLAVSDFLGDRISILLGNGDGTFQPAVDYATGSFPGNILTADFNGDGILDLAVAANNTTISVFIGNGNGTFRPKVDYQAGTSGQSVVVGDFNGDGFVDLAITDTLCSAVCPANGSVNVLLGNGDGTFQSPLDFAVGGQPTGIATGEFLYPGEQSGQQVGRLGFVTVHEQNNNASVFVAIPTGPVAPLPTISSISPTSVPVGSGSLTLTINGSNFLANSTVYFSGQARPTTFVNSTQLTASISANDVATGGTYGITVLNPAPGGGSSTPATFTVSIPAATISSLSPSSVVVGGPAFTLTVNGSNFVNGANINFNGAFRTTLFVNSTQLTASISAGDIATQGTINISVTDPTAGGSPGGTTTSLPLVILPTNTQPIVGGLSPASATAGDPSFTLLITGTGFTAGSIVTFNSKAVSSAFVSATELQASIPASAIAVAGSPFVTVANPGGKPSVVVSFIVNNPFPGVSSVSPSSVGAGSGPLTLNVTGTNFTTSSTTSSTVLVNGNSRVTTYISPTSLTAALPASDFAQSTTLNITVKNPIPGGGTSAPPQAVTVLDFNVVPPATDPPVSAGTTANFNLVLVPANVTTTSAVTFAVTSGLPANTIPAFLPSATFPAGTPQKIVTLSIATMPHVTSLVAPPSGGPRPRSRGPFLYWMAFALAFMVLTLRFWNGRAQRLVPQLLLAFLLTIAAGLAACGAGGGGSGPQINPATGTPAGSYPVVVTATSGSGSLSTTVTLTVQ
jgi:hypothetical protein